MHVNVRWILLAVAVLLCLPFCHHSLCYGVICLSIAHVFVFGVYSNVALAQKTRLKSNKPECDVFSITLYSEAFSSQYFFVVWYAFTQLLGVSALKNIKNKIQVDLIKITHIFPKSISTSASFFAAKYFDIFNIDLKIPCVNLFE